MTHPADPEEHPLGPFGHVLGRDPSARDVHPDRMAAVDALCRAEAIDNRMPNTKNLLNTYECERCGVRTTTVDVHVGMTPAFLECEQFGCGGTMRSGFYRPYRNLLELDEPAALIEYEWYRPLTPTECAYASWEADTPEVARYLLTGGLMRRGFRPAYDPERDPEHETFEEIPFTREDPEA